MTETESKAQPGPQSVPPGRRVWERLSRDRWAVGSAVLLGGLVLMAWLGPALQPYSVGGTSAGQFAPPGWQHWFGTDLHGRDLFVRVCAGLRLSLLVGAVGAGLAVAIGVAWGLTSGYLGGWVDEAMMRWVDILYSLPGMVFVIVLITALEQQVGARLREWWPGAGSGVRLGFLLVGLGAVSWLNMARIIRGQVLVLRTCPFVLASQALGAPTGRILWRHLLPNLRGIILACALLTVPAVVLYESFLSYLGLGVRPPEASLGTLLAEGASQINPIQSRWWLLVWPGAALAAALLSLGLLGDRLRDTLDVRHSIQ